MIVGKSVIRVLSDNDKMASDCRGIIFHPEVIVAQGITNLLVPSDLLVPGKIVRGPGNSRRQCS
jgi:hypothetical protein